MLMREYFRYVAEANEPHSKKTKESDKLAPEDFIQTKKLESQDLKKVPELNISDENLTPPVLEPVYPETEIEAGSDHDSAEEESSDYEYEETFTLREWFPPDFWRSKISDVKEMSVSKTVTVTSDVGDDLRVGNNEDDEDEFYYNLLKHRMKAAENVIVTDIKVEDETITFKVINR